MDLVRSANEKLTAAIDLIERLKVGTYPQPHSEIALERIQELFRWAQDELDPDADPNVLRNHCNLIIESLSVYMPLLGFVFRSKNSANAFELHGPLLRILQEILDEDTKLVLSSEWRFSPFTYVEIPRLSGFVWVGLPASESSNALLAPLAGHEFGHHLWTAKKLEVEYGAHVWDCLLEVIDESADEYRKHFPDAPEDLDEALKDVFWMSQWSKPQEWAIRQSEEMFCDLVGLRLFGTAYLYAFSYLLAPGPKDRQTRVYPPLTARVSFQIDAARKWDLDTPLRYADQFEETELADDGTKTGFLLWVADEAVSRLFPRIMDLTESLLGESAVSPDTQEDVERAFESFTQLAPIREATSLPAIMNAGWRAYVEESLWEDYPKVRQNRGRALNELLLKSAQVLEVGALAEDEE